MARGKHSRTVKDTDSTRDAGRAVYDGTGISSGYSGPASTSTRKSTGNKSSAGTQGRDSNNGGSE